jgi:hypothetical protein
MPQQDIDALNRAIAEAGADWVATETPYSRLDGAAATSTAMGLALTPEDAYADLRSARSSEFNMMVAAPPPPAIDWRSNNGNWVTPVRDQSTCGSCVAFATVAAIESRVLIAENAPGADFDLSEAHLFYCGVSNACALGWQPPPALAQAQHPGIGREASFPYKPGNQPCPIGGVPVVVTAGTQSTAATTVARKQALLDGPVIACLAVYGDFFHYGSGVYRHVTGNLAGYHAVCVVGYDDANACWIAKNSWNTSWGEHGYFRIRYGECGIDSQYPFYYPDSVALVPGTTIP